MSEKTQYFVSIEKDEAFMTIEGKGNYMNCFHVAKFFDYVVNKPCKRIFIDFTNCGGLDSTFLGMLADLALRLRNISPESMVALCNVSGRVLELIENMSLDTIMDVNFEVPAIFGANVNEKIPIAAATNEEVLNAHEKLSSITDENRRTFEDVIAFLKKQIKE